MTQLGMLVVIALLAVIAGSLFAVSLQLATLVGMLRARFAAGLRVNVDRFPNARIELPGEDA